MPDLQLTPIKPKEDPATITNPPEEGDTMVLAKKRLEAKLAMEGDDRKRMREEEDRKRREAENMARAEEERKKMTEMQRQKLAEEERLELEKEKADRAKKSTEITQTVAEIKSESGMTRPIRTLRADMENLIKTNNISLVSIAIKEDEKRKRNLESKSIGSKTNLTLIIVSTILILGTLSVGIYLYLNKMGAVPSIPDILSPGRNRPALLIPAEKTKEIDITGKSSDEVITRTIRDAVRYPEDLLVGRTENILLTKKIGSETHYLTLSEFLSTISATPPDQLARSLSPNFMFGVLSAVENSGFIIMTTDSYNSAFAGLLEWEKKGMVRNLYQILTTMKPDPELLSKPFEDMTIKNIGTRVLKDKAGTIRIVYAFLDSTKTIVIAGNKDAFLDALSSFQTPKPVTQ